MYRFTSVRCGIFPALAETLKEISKYISYEAKTKAKTFGDSTSKAIQFLKGENPNEDPALREKRRQHKELYHAILSQKAAQAQEEVEMQRRGLSWKEKLWLSLRNARKSLSEVTSPRAGVMALLEHCTASHAAEVALEQGIDVKNIQMVLEEVKCNNAVGYEEVVVGYIDAPAASGEEVMAFAEALHKACPVANSMRIEWRHGNAEKQAVEQGVKHRTSDLQDDMKRSARTVDMGENQSRSGDDSSSSAQSSSTSMAEGALAGMPGSRRFRNTLKTRSGTKDARALLRDDDELHLPELGRKHLKHTKDDGDGKLAHHEPPRNNGS